MDEQPQMVKPFEVRQDELVEKISHECMESGLPAGALALIVEKILINLRQEAHRAVMAYRQQEEAAKEDPGTSRPHSDLRRREEASTNPKREAKVG